MGPVPTIKKAIVTVAGAGPRFLPATKTMPKEMLPIVDKPIIQLVVEELVDAGIQDIILVTKWDKKPLEDHFDHNWALANELRETGKLQQLEKITRISEMANFIYIRQKGPYGMILLCCLPRAWSQTNRSSMCGVMILCVRRYPTPNR